MKFSTFVRGLDESETALGWAEADENESDPIDVVLDDVEEVAQIAVEYVQDWIEISKEKYDELDYEDKVKHVRKKIANFILQYASGSKKYIERHKDEIIERIIDIIDNEYEEKDSEE